MFDLSRGYDFTERELVGQCLSLQRGVHPRPKRRPVHRLRRWKIQDDEWYCGLYRLWRRHFFDDRRREQRERVRVVPARHVLERDSRARWHVHGLSISVVIFTGRYKYQFVWMSCWENSWKNMPKRHCLGARTVVWWTV